VISKFIQLSDRISVVFSRYQKPKKCENGSKKDEKRGVIHKNVDKNVSKSLIFKLFTFLSTLSTIRFHTDRIGVKLSNSIDVERYRKNTKKSKICSLCPTNCFKILKSAYRVIFFVLSGFAGRLDKKISNQIF